jgi:hypothetical protein
MGFSGLDVCFDYRRNGLFPFVSTVSVEMIFKESFLHNFINKCYIQFVEKLSPKLS